MLDGEFPVGLVPVENRFRLRGEELGGFIDLVVRETAAAGVRPWQFWRTLPRAAFEPRARFLSRRFDDPGRALALGALFRAMGGVSPFLLFWLAPLLCVPLLGWVAIELQGAGRGLAGGAFVLLVSASAFVIDLLALSYSALGFYLAALLALVALAGHALRRPPQVRGLLARSLATGLVFAAAALCRSGVVLLLPGLLLALAVGARRAARPGRRALAFLACLAALLLPYLALERAVAGMVERTYASHGRRRVPQYHDVWEPVWKGLGDFDRAKGHFWLDHEARRRVEEAGGRPELGPQSERILRGVVLAEVRADPLWYAGILARRLAATATQWKLRAFHAPGGGTFAPASSPNEGVIDAYYGLTRTVDVFGVAPAFAEVPFFLLPLPTLLLVALGLRAAAHPDSARAARLRDALLGVASLAAATIGVPLLISTATALETQAFALAYLLGAAFLLDEVARRRSSERGGAPGG